LAEGQGVVSTARPETRIPRLLSVPDAAVECLETPVAALFDDALRSRIRELVEEARTTPASHANAEQRLREQEASS
jgi:hypothetical protein